MSDLAGLIILCVFIVALVGLRLWSTAREKKRESLRPKTWTIIGDPPDGLYVALEVIRSRSIIPFERWGGIIEFVDGPFYCGPILAAGCLEDPYTPYIKLMKFKYIEKTALAHECRHIMAILKNQDYSESKEFYEWIRETNAEIAKQLGRA